MTAAIVEAVEAGEDVNEVEAAGNTPLHNAAYEGWVEGCDLLLSLGAKVNASNNAGDRPWHWAHNMGHDGVMQLLEKVMRQTFRGQIPPASNPEPDQTAVSRAALPPRVLTPKVSVLPMLQAGASTEQGKVLVQDHVPKVKDFFQKECWAHHPKPHAEYMEWRQAQDAALEAERGKLIPGM